MRTALPRAATLLVILALCLGLGTGCGKKAWPEPSKTEDAFTFARLSGISDGGCLRIESRMAGEWRNLKAVYVQLEEDGCETCPFSPTQTHEFVPGNNAELDRMGTLTLSICGLDSHKSYRWRLVGRNRNLSLRDVESEVLSTK